MEAPDTLAILGLASNEVRDAEKRLAEARQVRDQLIRQAKREGQRQVDIVKTTGLTREHIRKITEPKDGTDA